MESAVSELSGGLFIWQIVVLILAIVLSYIIIRFHDRISKYF